MFSTEKDPNSPVETPERELERRTRRAFIVMGLGSFAGFAGWKWLWNGEDEGALSSRIRRVLGLNERATASLLFRGNHLAPEFPASRIQAIRENGDEGLDDDIANDDWRLQVTPYGQKRPSPALDLHALRKLPKVEHVTEFKCIEGWSTVVRWGGARFSDFTAAFAPGSGKAKFVGLQTPNREYYVGIDMPSALHPQTLLCYEMNGQPLSDEHGAPLRLVIPVKYGIKNLKRIGAITYTDQRPDDFWAERGYDYYAAL